MNPSPRRPFSPPRTFSAVRAALTAASLLTLLLPSPARA